ncbi:hypothetical protein Tco_0373966 [Tanacetum coccineum]
MAFLINKAGECGVLRRRYSETMADERYCLGEDGAPADDYGLEKCNLRLSSGCHIKGSNPACGLRCMKELVVAPGVPDALIMTQKDDISWKSHILGAFLQLNKSIALIHVSSQSFKTQQPLNYGHGYYYKSLLQNLVTLPRCLALIIRCKDRDNTYADNQTKQIIMMKALLHSGTVDQLSSDNMQEAVEVAVQ